MCVVTGDIECVYLQNINFSIQFKHESPVFLKIMGASHLGERMWCQRSLIRIQVTGMLKKSLYVLIVRKCYRMHWLKAQIPRQGASFVWVILWDWSYSTSWSNLRRFMLRCVCRKENGWSSWLQISITYVQIEHGKAGVNMAKDHEIVYEQSLCDFCSTVFI